MGTGRIEEPAAEYSSSSESSWERVSIEEEKKISISIDGNENIPLEYFQPFFEDMCDEEFVMTIQSILDEHKHLRIENKIIQQFLNDNEPGMLSTLKEAKAKIEELEKNHLTLPTCFGIVEERITADMMPFTEGVQINCYQRSDILSRYADELVLASKRFHNDAARLCRRYRCEIEEATIRAQEAKDTLAEFEKNVVEAYDVLTKRIPAEKWTFFMAQWMKSARFITERIRMNLASTKVIFKKLKAIHNQKVELGVKISDIDFERLHVENKCMRELIDQKNLNVLEMKTIAGAANMELASTKKSLYALGETQAYLINNVQQCEEDILALQKETMATNKSLTVVEQKYQNVKDIVDHCKAPDAIDYLQVMYQYRELVKENKILCRQENVLNITRKTYEVYMLNLMHRNFVDPKWYLPFSESDDEVVKQTTPKGTSGEILPEFDIFNAINVTPIVKHSKSK